MNELNRRLDLQLMDREFPTKQQSLYSNADKNGKHGIKIPLMELYQRLVWKPIRSHLFCNSFDSILEYQNNFKVLDFNKNLSSLLGIIA